jgi:CRISPR-associated endoribonuclease Cas6
MSLQQHSSTTLHSIVVELAAVDVGYIAPTLSRALHALVLKWLMVGNPSVAEFVHTSQHSPLDLSGKLTWCQKNGRREF